MVYRSFALLLIASFLSVSFHSPAFAQRGPRPSGGEPFSGAGGDRGAGRTQLPEVGTMLPVVKAFDEQGNEFSTASLRGSYTVLVFGCLT